jgi:hypothetical protein
MLTLRLVYLWQQQTNSEQLRAMYSSSAMMQPYMVKLDNLFLR